MWPGSQLIESSILRCRLDGVRAGMFTRLFSTRHFRVNCFAHKNVVTCNCMLHRGRNQTQISCARTKKSPRAVPCCFSSLARFSRLCTATWLNDAKYLDRNLTPGPPALPSTPHKSLRLGGTYVGWFLLIQTTNFDEWRFSRVAFLRHAGLSQGHSFQGFAVINRPARSLQTKPLQFTQRCELAMWEGQQNSTGSGWQKRVPGVDATGGSAGNQTQTTPFGQFMARACFYSSNFH